MYPLCYNNHIICFVPLLRTSIILTFSINNVNTFYKVFFKANTLKTTYHLIFHHLYWSSPRPISIDKLNTLLHLHLRPINQVVFLGSYPYGGKSYLEVGFALRCFQRLSIPYIATQPCPWQNNWYTRGTSIPVLSY